MEKLYWRVRRQDGTWTYIPAVYDLHLDQVPGHPMGEVVTLWWPTPSELGEEE